MRKNGFSHRVCAGRHFLLLVIATAAIANPPNHNQRPLTQEQPQPLSLHEEVVDTPTLAAQAAGGVGSCCDFDLDTCTDGVLQSQCSGANQDFSLTANCCSRECLPPGETYHSNGVELLSQVDLSNFPNGQSGANDIWGYASPSGREYAILGLYIGTGFVEVTDPFHPVVVASPPDPLSIWSDMRTLGTYAYNVVDNTGQGMQIFDLSQIDNGIVTLVDTFTGGGFQTAHNIAINTETGYAYLCSTNIAQGFVAVNLANPELPVIEGLWNGASGHDMFVISYRHGVFAGREIAFLFGGGDHFYIIDVTDKSNMFTVSSIPTIPTGFGHQGWITQDLRHVIMGAELTNGSVTTTFVSNVENIEAPFYVNSYTNGLCSTDHNMMIKAGLSYHANYTSGLQVFDVSDPTNAQRIAFFDTHPENNNRLWGGAWGIFTQLPSGIVLLSDENRGLFVLNYDCNGNGIDDTLEIANQTSLDCNANGLPDECEYDPDGDGIPQACQSLPSAPLAEPAGTNKSRFFSFVVPPPAVPQVETALRVTLTSLYNPGDPLPVAPPSFLAREGEFRYVNLLRDESGLPVTSCLSSPAFSTFYRCATLGCTPEYADWASIFGSDAIHVSGSAIIPDSTYSVAQLASFCAGSEATCAAASAELGLATARFGDADVSGAVNVSDVVVTVDVVKDVFGAAWEYQSYVRKQDPEPNLDSANVTDIVMHVDALKLVAYAFNVPACP